MNDNRDNVFIDLSDNDAYNDFYATVSVMFRIASFVLLFAFLIYVVFSAFSSQGAFTYENFEYIVRNFALTLDERRNDSADSIRYNPDTSRSYSMIGNMFAACGNSGISIFSPIGRLTCTDSLYFKNPIMVTSEKYALIYDHGNSDYVVYNSFSRVHSQALGKPIHGACMSQDGSFALITSSDEYTSAVEVYNDNFKLINRFNKSGYVVDVDMSGELILIATVNKSDDRDAFNLQIHVYDLSEAKTISSVSLQTLLPLDCKIATSGFFVVCSDQTIMYEFSSESFCAYSYEGSLLNGFELTKDQIVLILDTQESQSAYNVLALDSTGAALYDYVIESTVYDTVICGEVSCLLTEEGLNVLGTNINNIISIKGEIPLCKLVVNDDNAVYVCTNSSASLVEIIE